MNVGKLRDLEVDFVVKRENRIAYVQVSYLLADEKTKNRETTPLLKIRDGFPKYIISMDPVVTDVDGIRFLNLVDDFLLGDGFSV